jgi:uncharacterized membrane protein YqjE
MDNKTTAPRPGAQNESLADVLKQIADDTVTLLRQEVALAKMEFNAKARSLRTGLIIVALGAAFTLIGLASIWAALVVWLTNFLSLEIAATVTGGGLALIGALMVFLGLKPMEKPFAEPVKSVKAL